MKYKSVLDKKILSKVTKNEKNNLINYFAYDLIKMNIEAILFQQKCLSAAKANQLASAY